jgi:hypothetical protein
MSNATARYAHDPTSSVTATADHLAAEYPRQRLSHVVQAATLADIGVVDAHAAHIHQDLALGGHRYRRRVKTGWRPRHPQFPGWRMMQVVVAWPMSFPR